MYYILKDKIPVRCHDIKEWAKFMKGHSHIASEIIQGYRVLTVFTGMDYSLMSPHPVVFETKIFDEKTHQAVREFQTKCCTYSEAEEMHKIALQWLRRCFLEKKPLD